MEFSLYQELASRTSRDSEDRIQVDVLGLAGEVGEICSEFQHASEQHRGLNKENIIEEIGDILWRLSDICSALHISLDVVAKQNIEKLKRRHPNGFSAETSLARIDKNG